MHATTLIELHVAMEITSIVKKSVFATPQDAEAAFYEAFTKSDLDAMMAVWADDDDIYCVHPQGGRVTGVADVRESWRRIFNSRQTLTFALREQHLVHGMMFSVHCVYEDIQLEDESHARASTVATNIYMRTDQGWRMVAHHASPAAAPTQPATRSGPKTLH
jgi:ketosteroid isomerase-like protein